MTKRLKRKIKETELIKAMVTFIKDADIHEIEHLAKDMFGGTYELSFEDYPENRLNPIYIITEKDGYCNAFGTPNLEKGWYLDETK